MKRAVVVFVGFVRVAIVPMYLAPHASAATPTLSSMLLSPDQCIDMYRFVTEFD
jgi:hypothetical protein